MSLLVDAGPLYASVDADDDHHAAAAELFTRATGPLLVPMLVIAEVAYLIGKRLHAEAEVRFLGDIATGAFAPEPVHAADWTRIAELVFKYRDMSLGTTDASLVAAAERLKIRRVATLDHRHFAAVKPTHVDAFELVA